MLQVLRVGNGVIILLRLGICRGWVLGGVGVLLSYLLGFLVMIKDDLRVS